VQQALVLLDSKVIPTLLVVILDGLFTNVQNEKNKQTKKSDKWDISEVSS